MNSDFHRTEAYVQSMSVPKIWAVIKPRLGSDKTGFYSLHSKETDIVTLKLN